MPGVPVDLVGADDAVVASTTTGADGSYTFTGLIPGSYRVRFTVPEGFSLPGSATRIRGTVRATTATGTTDPIAVVAGQAATGVDIALWPDEVTPPTTTPPTTTPPTTVPPTTTSPTTTPPTGPTSVAPATQTAPAVNAPRRAQRRCILRRPDRHAQLRR